MTHAATILAELSTGPKSVRELMAATGCAEASLFVHIHRLRSGYPIRKRWRYCGECLERHAVYELAP